MAILVKKIPKTAKAYKARYPVTVEDATHESEISRGEIFYLQKTAKGFYLYDVDTDSKSGLEAFKFSVDKRTHDSTAVQSERQLKLRTSGTGPYVHVNVDGRNTKYYVSSFDEAIDAFRIVTEDYSNSALGEGSGDIYNTKGNIVGTVVSNGGVIEPIYPGTGQGNKRIQHVKDATKSKSIDAAPSFGKRTAMPADDSIQLSDLNPAEIEKAVTAYRKFLKTNNLSYEFQPSHINHHYYFDEDGDVAFGISDTMSVGGDVSVNIGGNTPLGKKFARIIKAFPGDDMSDGDFGVRKNVFLPESFLIYLDNPKFHSKPPAAFARSYTNR